jgi:hypothetical protein
MVEWAMREDEDLAYFEKRAGEEEALTTEAVGRMAQGAHARMSLAYRQKVRALRENPSYTIVPEP